MKDENQENGEDEDDHYMKYEVESSSDQNQKY